MNRPRHFRTLAIAVWAVGAAASPVVCCAQATAEDADIVASPATTLTDALLIIGAVVLAGGYLYRRLFRSKNRCAGCTASKECPTEDENK